MDGTEHRPSGRRALAAVAALAVALAAGGSLVAAADASEAAGTSLLSRIDVAGASELGLRATGVAAASAAGAAGALTPPPPPRVHCPVPGSMFVDSWGFARSGGRGHKGVDMMAPHGTPVVAPFAGTVRSSNSALGGLGFYLDDADGNTFFGSHLATLDVTGWVEAGTVIGTVGSTGNASSPHLHFEIAPGGGTSVNPYPYAYSWCMQDPADPWAEVLRP